MKIYDYSGMNLLGSVDTSGRVYVAYNTSFGSFNALMIIDPGADPTSPDDDEVLLTIAFPQTDALITGVALKRYGLPASTEDHGDYHQFILYSGADLYVMREGDTSGGEGVIDPNDPAFEGIEGDTLLYDHSGSTLLDSFAGLFPVEIQMKENGFFLVDYQEDVSSWQYVYDGDGTFAGLSTVPDSSSIMYGPGSSFTLDSPGAIYLITAEDLDDSGQDPDDGGGNSGVSGDNTGGNTGGGSGVTDAPLGDIQNGINDTNNKLDGIEGAIGGIQGAIGGTNDKLDDLISGGTAGDKLDGVIGDLNSAEGGLPELPDNLSELISAGLADSLDSEIWQFMLWYDDDFGVVWDVIFVPTSAGLAASLLMYIIFGKASLVG